MFRVGQKVVCISGWQDLGMGLVKTGDIVTISKIYSGFETWPDGVIGLEFSDALLPPRPHSGYDSKSFRPLAENKADISIFTKMLTTTKVTEDA
jgi:hypothetical protein